MKIFAVETGKVAVRPSQSVGKGSGLIKMLNVLTDKRWTAPLPIYAWVIDHPDGIILIDTGDISRTMEPGYFPSWHPYFKNVRFWIKPEEEVGNQLKNIGIQPSEVKQIIMTHLHTDHAGGMNYFPNAEIFIYKKEYNKSLGLRGLLQGYLNYRFPKWLAPKLFEFNNEPFGPFSKSLGFKKGVTIVPTFGHTGTHISVIVNDEDMNYFIAGDASYTQDNMLQEKVDGVSLNNNVALNTLRNIKNFAKSYPTIYLPSHDPNSAKRLENKEVVFNSKNFLVNNYAT